MTGQDLVSLLPLLVLTASIVIVMLVTAFWRNHRLTFGLILTGLVLSLLSLPLASRALPHRVTPLLVVDQFAVFYMALVFLTSLVVVLISFSYMDKLPGNKDEYYMLILLATLGACTLVLSNHFVAFFLGLEILSLSLPARTRRSGNQVFGPGSGGFCVSAFWHCSNLSRFWNHAIQPNISTPVDPCRRADSCGNWRRHGHCGNRF
jgi:hypothetical protein